ncbi:MAG: cupin domain-containing protein [Chloroflexota bacterium]|nr:cupin domain-containing protein [Chloroflexota bacterium]
MSSQYDQMIALAKETEKRARSGKIVIKGESLAWENARHGRRAFISDPDVLGSSVQTMNTFLSEIPPGGFNGRHRHFNEALIYILQGRGYSIIDGQRYDWEQGDSISVPLYAWHQHFNADPDKPVLYLGCTNVPLLRKMGLNKIEDDETSNASNYEGDGQRR